MSILEAPKRAINGIRSEVANKGLWEAMKQNPGKTALIAGGTIVAAHVVTSAFKGRKQQALQQQRYEDQQQQGMAR